MKLSILEVGSMARVKCDKVSLLKNKLTLSATGNRDYTLELYEEHEDGTISIPRTMVGLKSNPYGHRTDWLVRFNCDFPWELRPEQKHLIASYIDAIKGDSPFGGILKAKTGTGKSVVATQIATTIGLKTLIIVPTVKLMEQWRDEVLLEFTDLTEDDIGIIQQNKCEVKGKKVVLAMVHSLAQKKYADYVYNSFGLVIYDEIHVLGAETFSRTAGMFDCAYRLGLSATPRRKDGMEKVFKYHIGEIIAESQVVNAIPNVYIIPYKGKDTSHSRAFWGGQLSLGTYQTILAKSTNRTLLLTNIVNKLYNNGKHILVLSDRIKILEDLDGLIDVPKDDIGFLHGKSKKFGDSRVILGTYGVAGIGADIPRLDALVFATPRVDIEQACGRVLRKRGITPVIVDVVDMSSSIIRNWCKARIKYYDAENMNVTNRAW